MYTVGSFVLDKYDADVWIRKYSRNSETVQIHIHVPMYHVPFLHTDVEYGITVQVRYSTSIRIQHFLICNKDMYVIVQCTGTTGYTARVQVRYNGGTVQYSTYYLVYRSKHTIFL